MSSKKINMKVTKKAIKEFVRAELGKNPVWALRALEVVYDNQTADEQATQSTRILNGVGFTGTDGEILSSFAKQYSKWKRLSEKQMAIVFKKMPKYWMQVLAVADIEKIENLVRRKYEQAN
jgi:hypothetical protein